MTSDDLPTSWAARFGLASSPLFGARDSALAGSHHVLLDGGLGSFALSVSSEPLWKERVCADWSWSCNLPHHVTITDNEVAVVRWDKSNPELFTRRSVEDHISTFYSYLTSDRVQSTERVVEFMLSIYRSIRSLVAAARMEDARSIDAFLAFLSLAIRRTHDARTAFPMVFADQNQHEDVLSSLSQRGVEALFDESFGRGPSDLLPSLVPSLAIRHAGSEIFQEAHFELLRAPDPNLFGHVGPATTKPIVRGSAHFTPPALARTVVDQTLAQVPDLRCREELVLLDPACGSGAFLHEALRALRRTRYDGRLVLVGQDTSKAAVTMAEFVLANAVADWSPKGGCELQLQAADSLTARLPAADLVLMNPPFVSWAALTSKQRSDMRQVLGNSLVGRGDYCMAFVSRALAALRPGGALGTLLPGSLLALGGADRWRASLLEQADLRFIASLGDYSLFRYAQVQVSAIVLAKQHEGDQQPSNVIALVAGSEPEATGTAFRNLRRVRNTNVEEIGKNGWHLFTTSSRVFRNRPTWRLIRPSTEGALNRLLQSGFIAPIDDLFSVRQGVRTGRNSAFVMTTAEFRLLPRVERAWFRQASVNESIQDGAIRSSHYVFYPYGGDGLLIRDEQTLKEKLPVYCERYLQPNRAALSRRANIVRAGRQDWWGLSEWRRWALEPGPRIVSKYFGGPGSFAPDLDAAYIVVQGFAWMPIWETGAVEAEDVSSFGIGMREMLTAYSTILNSDFVARVLRLYSQHVAGGQYDLSWRFVKGVPIPNLPALLCDEHASEVVLALARIGQGYKFADPVRRSRTERFVTELYGAEFVERMGAE